MSYMALYRKFRPGTFDEVKGQDHIVTTLQNQIKTDRIGHAYLFTGTRGTGKTTVARILAKAINCENPHDGSPCGQCPMCKAINSGNSMNVIEIDAASNNSVANVRDIIEEVAYPPTEGKYKVYIIDEVHMLRREAFNALLKTLEEPPAYVIFILATTEVHKIPITIMSRCQRYDFHRISIDTISARLSELLEAEGVKAEEKAVRYVAKAGDGSMRDALSLLDQCIAFYIGQELTYDNVLNVLGAIDTEVYSRLLRDIVSENVTDAINLLDEIIIQGRELGQFVTDFTWYLRNLLLVKTAKEYEDVLEMSSENIALIKEEAKMVESPIIMRYIHIFSDLSNELKYASQKRVLIEIAIIKLCHPEMELDISSLNNRMDKLEKKVAKGVPVATMSPEIAAAGQRTSEKKQPLPPAIAEDVEKAIKQWAMIVGEAGPRLKGYLRDVTTMTVTNDQELKLVYDQPEGSQAMTGDLMSTDENRKDLEEIIEKRIGKHIKVLVEINKSGVSSKDQYTDVQDYFAGIGIEVDEEDE